MTTHYTKAWDIEAYTYRADVYCPECVTREFIEDIDTVATFGGSVHLAWETTEDMLNRIAREWFGIDREGERTFDSDTFPKVVFASQVEEGEYCGRCGTEL